MPSTNGRRRRRRLLIVAVGVALAIAVIDVALLGRNVVPGGEPSAIALPSPIAVPAGAVLLAGAGDIATCASAHDSVTGRYLETLDAAIFTTGDNAYERGSTKDFADCYDPVWGRSRDRTHPVPGNHEYATRGAAGYFAYFGDRVGTPERPWYAWDLNGWRIYGLDSDCVLLGGCRGADGEAAWLDQDMAAHPAQCVAAMWHHPRYSSGEHGDTTDVQELWATLADAGAELLLTGHDHSYERFTPRNATGAADPDGGLREFVVGTGGKDHYHFDRTNPLSEVKDDRTFGVLVLTLWPDRYEWRFVATEGTFSDSGSGTCH